MRALETAIAVCYARAFTQSKLHRLDLGKYEPADPQLAELHRTVRATRQGLCTHG
jgi:hypothetical protein